MSQNETNSIISTASGIFGGLSNALIYHELLGNITIRGIAEVAFYAAVSAIVGYGVKLTVDCIRKYFKP